MAEFGGEEGAQSKAVKRRSQTLAGVQRACPPRRNQCRPTETRSQEVEGTEYALGLHEHGAGEAPE
jgi:hypothetical protein